MFIRIAHNAVKAVLIEPTPEVRRLVSTKLSYIVEGFAHSQKAGKGKWDGRSSFFTYKTNSFPAGFVPSITAALQTAGYTVEIVKKPLPEPLGDLKPKVDDFPDDPRYDYQPEVMKRLIKHGMMIAQVATGGGKSRIAKLCYSRIGRNTLFITTRGVLADQMADDFDEFLMRSGEKCGRIGDSKWKPRDGFTIAMVQTLAARLEFKTLDVEMERYLEAQHNSENKKIATLKARIKASDKKRKNKVTLKEQSQLIAKLRKKMVSERKDDEQAMKDILKKIKFHNERRLKVIEYLETIDFVILEEAHEVSSSSFFDVMNACKNAHYRLSLTATPFMKSDIEANLRLMAVSGQVAIKVTEKMLIDRGILAKPIFKFYEDRLPMNVRLETSWTNAYKRGIMENEIRNSAIVYEAERAAKHGLPVMILVQRKDHGRILNEMLSEKGVEASFIFGEHKADERKFVLNLLRVGKIDSLIGSTILDVGVDVPAVGMIILAGGGKAEVALRQRIGRGLREKKYGPNQAFIVDFSDRGNKHLEGHAFARRKIIEGTDGFAENVLGPDEDFDYTPFEKDA